MAHLKLERKAAVLGRFGVDLEDRSAEWNLAASLKITKLFNQKLKVTKFESLHFI